jgi:C-terminal processing protease CtpA/Prc
MDDLRDTPSFVDCGTTLLDSDAFVKIVPAEIKPALADTTDLTTFLSTPGRLTLEEEKLLVDQSLVLLEMFYVHMPLKRAMHAIEPLQKLRLIQHQLTHTPDGKKMDEMQFHSQMLKIFTSLRDLHTNYLLPAPFSDKTAILPFLIEEYFDNGSRKYMVSRVASGLNHPTFKRGVEVLYWNGIPIDRAIEINADFQAGSNLEARHAQGLDSMTIRPLKCSLPPDEMWVFIGYRSLAGEALEIRQNWLIISDQSASGSGLRGMAGAGTMETENAARKIAMLQGNDLKTQMIQDVKKVMFAPNIVISENRIARGEISTAASPVSMNTTLPGILEARVVNTPFGDYGYIRIRSFNVPDDKLIPEILRLMDKLPQNGLMIDVRGNGGGYIWASERLLQSFTPRHIKPEPSQFINTPWTVELCRRISPDLDEWYKSMEQYIETGATYSQGVPLTPENKCNNIGQRYYGPVALITDALCYSATDIFAAGFQDNLVGPVIGINRNTGAGGANVWEWKDLKDWIGENSPVKSLPKGSELRVSIRRLLRVNQNEGMPLEDLGVVPNHKYDMTREDVLEDNVGLKNYVAGILSKMPSYSLSVNTAPQPGGKLAVEIKTHNISRLDIFLGDRPLQSMDLSSDLTRLVLDIPPENVFQLEFRGYEKDQLVAVHRAQI